MFGIFHVHGNIPGICTWEIVFWIGAQFIVSPIHVYFGRPSQLFDPCSMLNKTPSNKHFVRICSVPIYKYILHPLAPLDAGKLFILFYPFYFSTLSSAINLFHFQYVQLCVCFQYNLSILSIFLVELSSSFLLLNIPVLLGNDLFGAYYSDCCLYPSAFKRILGSVATAVLFRELEG